MIDWNTLLEWEKDWEHIHAGAITKRRAFYEHTTHQQRFQFSVAIRFVRYGRRDLVREFASGFADQLESDSSVHSTMHLDRLLDLAVKHAPGKQPDPRRWFDALSLFDQTIAIAKIEREDEQDLVGTHLYELIDFLGSHVFINGFESHDFFVYHDPKREFWVGPNDVHIDRSLRRTPHQRVRRKVTMTCRRTCDQQLVFLHDRIKDPFSLWLKIHWQIHNPKISDPFVVHDRCGLMFVMERREDIVEFAQVLQSILEQHGGSVSEKFHANFGLNQSADVSNQESSSAYKVAKLRMIWHGREFEFQFIALHDYFNAKRSLSDANHALYKLKKMQKFAFPLLWPESVFGLNWDSPHVRTQMRLWITSNLGWHVNGHTLT